MKVKLVIDMNLSQEWVTMLTQHGCEAIHWSNIGNPRAEDSLIMAWALAHGYAVFTHDLVSERCSRSPKLAGLASYNFAEKVLFRKTWALPSLQRFGNMTLS